MTPERTPPMLFGLADHPAHAVAASMGLPVAAHRFRRFEDGEHKCRPLESPRDRDVYLIDTLNGERNGDSVNDRLVATCFFLSSLRDAGAWRITAVFPYLCYSRKDRRTKLQDPVNTRYVAQLLESTGIDRIVTVDVHNPAAFENAFRIPAENLSAAEPLIDALLPFLGPPPCVILSPDIGGIKRAENFRQRLTRMTGQDSDLGFMEKHRSAGKVTGESLVARVASRDVVIIDDLISSGGTLARAARACQERGARRVIAIATHGLFNGDARKTLDAAGFHKLFVTDTVSRVRDDDLVDWPLLTIVPIAPLLADAIRSLHQGDCIWSILTPLPEDADFNARLAAAPLSRTGSGQRLNL